jgi:serine/threonine protein kinase
VLGKNGYDGSAADIWSCGVILYVLMAGYLPFEENDLPSLYEKVPASFQLCISAYITISPILLIHTITWLM